MHQVDGSRGDRPTPHDMWGLSPFGVGPLLLIMCGYEVVGPCVDVGFGDMWAIQSMCSHLEPLIRNTIVIQESILLVEVLGRIMEACEGQWTHRRVGWPPMWAHNHQSPLFLLLYSNEDMYMWNQVICIKFITSLHISFPKRHFVDGLDYVKLWQNYSQHYTSYQKMLSIRNTHIVLLLFYGINYHF
jgi:hypothetical protein